MFADNLDRFAGAGLGGPSRIMSAAESKRFADGLQARIRRAQGERDDVRRP
jgi:hypothetical protein